MTVRGLLIAVERYHSRSGLPPLKGTVQRALDFREWLITAKGAAPDDVILCASPRRDPAQFGATDTDVLNAVLHLIKQGRDTTDELFVFHSGHGFQKTYDLWTPPDDVIVPSSYQPAIGGRRCLKVAQLRYFLARMMGPGVHVWFVDACRIDLRIEVGNLELSEQQPSLLGEAETNWIFSTAPNTGARATSAFVPSLLAGLRGQNHTIAWLDTGYFVTFDRLAAALEKAMAAENTQIDARPESAPTPLVHIDDVEPVACEIRVEGAELDDRFVALLAGPEQLDTTFHGEMTTLIARPGTYHAAVLDDGALLQPVHPLHYPVEIYEPVTLRFSKARRDNRPASITPDFDPVPHLTVQLSDPAGEVVVIGAQESIGVAAGEYEMALFDRGEPVGRSRWTVEAGADVVPTIGDFVTPSPVFEAVRTYSQRERLAAIDLNEVMPQPGYGADLLVNPDPALILTILGTAAICDATPYTDLIEPLPSLDDARPGDAALYVLDTPAEGGKVEAGGSSAGLEPVAHLEAISCAVLRVKVGPTLLAIHHPSLGEMSLATYAYANRATLIVLARDDQRLAIRQHALPVGHLARFIYQDGRIPMANYGLLHAVRFADRVQARFGSRGGADLLAHDQNDGLFSAAVRRGEWPDPITPVMAAFDEFRAGWLADPRELARRVDHLRTGSGALPDFVSLASIAGAATQGVRGWPLLLDAVLVSGTATLERPKGYELIYDGPWVVFRRVSP